MTRHKRHRDGAAAPARTASRRGEAYWLFGRHPVALALANPDRQRHRLLVAPGTEPPPLPDGPAPETVARADLERLLPERAVHQGLALLASPLPEQDLDEACRPAAGERPRVVVLDQVTDPQNVGAVLRCAAAFGAAAVVVTRDHSPAETGTLAKAASGALELVPLVRVTNLARALDRLAELGYWRFGLDAGGATTLADADLAGPVALVLGAEGAGLRRLTAERCDHLVRLPTDPRIGSLNVSAACAVALYEAHRTLL
jgi:23S rRNA (guanosine2251-2'-O)-methyltransferase